MSESSSHLTVGNDLAINSLEQMRDEFLRRQSRDAKEFITGAYINGVVLWDAHIEAVREDIEAAGGIKRILTYDRDHTNAIKCKDKSVRLLSDILMDSQIELAMPENTPSFDLLDTTQHAWAQLTYGSNFTPSLGSRYEIDGTPFMTTSDIEDIIEGDYRPTEIGLTEAVTTFSATENTYTSAGHRYLFSGLLWGAKLREEFAPDPYKQPEAYAFWMATEPTPRLDVSFSATVRPSQAGYKDYPPEFSWKDDDMRAFYAPGTGTHLTVEGAEKMLRGAALVDMYWQQQFGGASMPMPNAGAFSRSPKTKELTA